MTIEQLEAFIAAAKSDSFFTGQSEAHRYHTSAAKEILELEAEFKTLLFLREGDATGKLTEAGKTLLKEAIPLVRNYHKAIRLMEMYRPNAERRIIIGSLPIIKQYRLRNVFSRYQDEHEEVDFTLEETDGKTLIEGLRENYYDAIIIRKNMLYSMDVNYATLAQDEMAAILWEDHPLASEPEIRLAQLKNEVFYLVNPTSSSFGQGWNLLKENMISTENVVITDLNNIIPEISKKHGVGLLPISSLNRYRQKGVVAVPLLPRAVTEIVFAYRKDIEISKNMQDLIDLIEERAKGF
ncbi:MAG: LysR family transcriptional regulator [Solobacterium sp.]|nr:LysR family transcriptional regulator [Solobacterium sp.]